MYPLDYIAVCAVAQSRLDSGFFPYQCIIDHNPKGAREEDLERQVARYAKTLAVYKDLFGLNAPVSVWPPPLVIDTPTVPTPLLEAQTKWMQLYVKDFYGNTNTILGHADQTVLEFKQLLAAKIDVPVDQMRLIFAGKQLEDERTIGSYNINKDPTTLHLVQRIRGC